MNLWLGLLMGLKEIWAHKFRSFLTMLGVILGVASLLSMFSLTAGMARGFRLNIPAGTAVRFEPGQSREVELVELAGSRDVYGFQGKIMGRL